MSTHFSFLISSLKTAQKNKKKSVIVKTNKLCLSVLRVLHEEGYIAQFEHDPVKNEAKVFLKYAEDATPVIYDINRISKSGSRVHVKSNKIPRKISRLGTCIVSTSRGVLSHAKAIEKNLGGELLCIVC